MSTKKLAKELGLLRKRSQLSNRREKSQLSNQIYSYLIVIDFESTCWREKKHYGQEIIEFPAVLLNTSTGEVEAEFHSYVQPQEHPVLSDFCTELTGITQAQVESGVPLQICLSRFSRWLQTQQLQRGVAFSRHPSGSPAPSNKLCSFVTWSDWDLGVCLQYECRRKQLHKPDVLNSWTDLRSTYRLFYSRKPKGLNGALQDLGIQFSGRQHSGLDDARNTAGLAWRMMKDGCVMKITRGPERVMRNPQRNTRTSEPLQNLLSPLMTVLTCLNSPLCGGRIGTVNNNSFSSLVLVSTTMDHISHNTRLELTPDPEAVVGLEEEVPSSRPPSHLPAPPSSSRLYSSVLSSSSRPPSLLSSLNISFPPSSRGVARITSPLCACGRRAKRQTVANGGPNHGQVFYCCPAPRTFGTATGGTRKRAGCGFFRWESAIINATAPSPRATPLSRATAWKSSVRF
ncbi:ERI1 exoribonuclease 2 [Osmerus mordax]|uniref:ERI1 exoribonuclease 2 n=1 Tax=Osmerus mordax TaxID=8014 RepID=UPI0035109F22